jgi:N-acetylglucosamine kinase-like BadF-type ATPase
MPKFYLGLDGGQSSTKALIADEDGRVVGSGVAGPCNHVSGAEARQKFVEAVGGCVTRACEQAGLPFSSTEFAAACLGFSGGAEDKEVFAREVIRSARYKITHDAEIALSGATAGQPGIIVIAGTGSMGFGLNASGKTARAGGWGYVFGDEGGAFDIVRRALRNALKLEEGYGPQTILREHLIRAARARDANELLHRFYTPEFPRDRVAALAPLVTEAAAAGDEIAATILASAAADLAKLAANVHSYLFEEFESVPVCYIGGVFRSDLVRNVFSREVRSTIHCDVGPPIYSPAAGALIQALRLDENTCELVYVPESER